MRPSGVLAYPSYPPWPVSLSDRLEHVWALRERHGLELAPLDLGSVGIVVWDERTQSFGPGVDLLREHGVVANPLPFLLDALERSYALGMVPSARRLRRRASRARWCSWRAPGSSGRRSSSRSSCRAPGRSGRSRPRRRSTSTCGRSRPTSTSSGSLVPYALDDPALVERLCRHALARGGGIRVGIGDNPAAFPDATNAGAGRACRAMGRRGGSAARVVGRRAPPLRPAGSRVSAMPARVLPALGARGAARALSARGAVDRRHARRARRRLRARASRAGLPHLVEHRPFAVDGR